MTPDASVCYQAVLSRDRRFDGAFFVAVSSTGIYCRTVCSSRTPKAANCSFYPSAAAAERAGFRPCLRCRPELAPGNASIDAASRLTAVASARIEEGALSTGGMEELSDEVGCSSRHLRRVFQSQLGVSPVQLAQTQRLLAAKRLLTDSDLSVGEVAFASGFSSVRRMNALFRERYHLNPDSLRTRGARRAPSDVLCCELSYRSPYDWGEMLAFLRLRACRGVEFVDERRYVRTVRFRGIAGWLTAEPQPEKDSLRVEISASLVPVVVPILTRVKRLFDLEADPVRIAGRLGPFAARRPGLRVPGSFNRFETAVRGILGQQVSVRAATTIMGRFAEAFGQLVETPFHGLTTLFPTVERTAGLTGTELAALGIPLTRANTVISVARAICERQVRLGAASDVHATMLSLIKLPGIGEWTAQYIAMRALSWPDAFPHTDLGIRVALGIQNPAEILQVAEQWRPWRAYAAIHLWTSLKEKA